MTADRKGPTKTMRLRTAILARVNESCRETRMNKTDVTDRLLAYALSHVMLRDAVCKDLTFDDDK
jgi:hypothetical protein